MVTTEVAIIGAGPYGLAIAAHLRRAGVDHRVFGHPMSFWRTMPEGMVLRSSWTATCIGEYEGELSLDSFVSETGTAVTKPVPLHRFIEYGEWVQRKAAPDVDIRTVERVSKTNGGFELSMLQGEAVTARRVIVAAGIEPFVRTPAEFAELPKHLATHTSEHLSFKGFEGKRVVVVGGGQSALESAALLKESGADVEVLVRKGKLNWLHGGKYARMLGRFAPLLYAPTDVGPMGLSRLVAVPELFGQLPRNVQEKLAYRAIRPAGALWLYDRLADVPIRMATQVQSAKPTNSHIRVDLTNGDSLEADHLVYGTGYQVDITKYPFLPAELLNRVQQHNGYPLLRRGLESSLSGLHFVGAPAAWSFGPIMRFVSGGWYAAASVVRAVTRD